MQNGELQLSDGLTTFRLPGGDALALDLIEADIECSAIRERTKGAPPYQWVDEFIVWIEKMTGHKLTRGVAHELWRQIQIALSRANKSFIDALGLPNSTDSGPAA